MTDADVVAQVWSGRFEDLVREEVVLVARDERGLVSGELREVLTAQSAERRRERIRHVLAPLEPVARKSLPATRGSRGRPHRLRCGSVRALGQALSTNPFERVAQEIG